MKIESSMVGMESVRTYSRNETKKFNLSEELFGGFLGSGAAGDENSVDGRALQDKAANVGKNTYFGESITIRVVTVEPERGVPMASKLRESCLEYLWQCLFGEKRQFDCKEYGDLTGSSDNGNYGMSGSSLMNYFSGAEQGPTVTRVNFTMEQRISEQETVQFSTKGRVHCEDGRNIDFDMNIFMSRRFEESVKLSGTAEIQRMIDPLVINLKGSVASVSDMTFLFDLDADGQKEEIGMLSEGSGFLALDKNGDGVINDGSELFGTKSGDGFGDLAKYDKDGNGWIDENDAVFDDLKIWSKDSFGNDVLYTLKEAGVGAIYLGKSATDFSLTKSGTENRSAQIRETGIFLYESGMAGTIQHLDMTAYN